jgi:GNAT superfamily N-acetyltransferase
MRIKFVQDINQAIEVMKDAGEWLEKSGKNPSKWWQPKNLNRRFLLQYAKPEEFYVGLVDGKPAVAAILQIDQSAQDWQSVDKNESQEALYIHWLCVKRESAGKQLPRQMIDFASGLAESKGVKLLRADANASEIKLGKIYQNLGFNLVAIEKEDYRQTAFYQKQVN